jgi:hypothetical protein
MCHFVLDHITDLDGTVTVNGEARQRPAPYLFHPTLKAELFDAWDAYPQDPHNA